tara:strand:- start:71 stop:499 length:429 start_codon:yes stop_codon:yes gene_type:complete
MEVIKKGHTFESVIYDTNEIDNIWNEVKDEIKRTDCEFLNHKDIKILLKDGYYILWIVREIETKNIVAVVIIEIVLYLRHKISRVVSIGGSKLEQWLDYHLHVLEEWSKNNGCSHMDIYGRRGWKKMLKEYKEHCILLRKKL